MLHRDIKSSQDLMRYELSNHSEVVLARSGMFWVGYGNTVWFLDKCYGISNKEWRTHYDKTLKRRLRRALFHVTGLPKIRQKLLDAGLEVVYDEATLLVFRLPERAPDEQLRSWDMILLGETIVRMIQECVMEELREPLGADLLGRMMRLLCQYAKLGDDKTRAEERVEAVERLGEEVRGLLLVLEVWLGAGMLHNDYVVGVEQQLKEVVDTVKRRYL
ncbi:hypothetical protein FWH13_02075 [Candidatus Saccharibacteria bacterium]|nr:hypothetical protein [Candidatus Saccharibacteria bacterium]